MNPKPLVLLSYLIVPLGINQDLSRLFGLPICGHLWGHPAWLAAKMLVTGDG